MQKTNKSLLVKFLTVLCALCFLLVLAFGLVGCGEEQVSIVDSAINSEGKLVLTYSDGTTKEYDVIGKDGEDGKDLAACGHDSYVQLTPTATALVVYEDDDAEMNTDICRATLMGCTVCDHVYATYVGHELGEVETVEPYCYYDVEKKEYVEVDGYEGQKCKYCDYKVATEIEFEDHNWEEIKLIKDSNVCACTTTWYSGKKVCLDCGKTELKAEKPLGHKFTNIRVGEYATDTQKATLVADCEQCNGTAILVKELYKLGTEEAAANYVKTVGNTGNAGHYATYTYSYEGKEYTVSLNFFENHVLKIDDYTEAKYPGVIIMSTEGSVVCNEGQYVKGVYTCDDCGKGVSVDVKKAHVFAENATYKSTTATCIDAGVEYYECTACKELVGKNVAAYGHNHAKLEAISDEYVNEGKKLIDITLSCTRENGGVVCGDTITEPVQNYVKVDPTCSDKGSITYTTADGQSKTKDIPASGKHVLAGYTKGDIVDNCVLDYADVKDSKSVIYMSDDIPATCGASAKVTVVCDTCGKGISATVTRNHIKIDKNVTKEPTCVEEGILSFKCQYEDCQYHSVATTEPIEKIGHKFEFVSATDTTVTVKCSVEGCTYASNTTFDIFGDVVKVADKNCKDYKDGNPNYNQYFFMVDDVKYDVKEELENTTHVFNKKNFEVGDEFVQGTPGIIDMAAAPLADCTQDGEGTIVCELCGKGVKVVLTGECQVPENLEEVTLTDEISCEKDAYNYWICAKPGCGKRHDLSVAAKATGHNFVYTVSNGIATVSCEHKAENCECGAKECNDCNVTFEVVLADVENKTVVETCKDITTTYIYTYVNGDYKQDVKIVVVENIGEHDWLLDANGEEAVCRYIEVVEGKIVKVGYGRFCTECGEYEIYSWEPPVAEWVK